MIKLKLISLLALALMLGACADDNKKQKPTTETETTEPTKPPVTKPTTEPATAPFAIKITDIKDYYNFGVVYSKIHLTDKDGIIIKTKVLDNQPKQPDEYIKQVEFKNLKISQYKLCFQVYEINRITHNSNGEPQILDNICDYWLTETNKNQTRSNLTSEKNQAQIINTNLITNLVLPKSLSIKIKGLNKKTVGLLINTKANKSHAFFAGYENNINYYQKVDLKKPKVVICNLTSSGNNYNFTCLNKDNSFKKNTILGSSNEEPALNPTKVNSFFSTLDRFNLNDIEEINF